MDVRLVESPFISGPGFEEGFYYCYRLQDEEMARPCKEVGNEAIEQNGIFLSFHLKRQKKSWG